LPCLRTLAPARTTTSMLTSAASCQCAHAERPSSMAINGGGSFAFQIRSTPMPFASGSEASHSSRRIEGVAPPGHNGVSPPRVSVDTHQHSTASSRVERPGAQGSWRADVFRFTPRSRRSTAHSLRSRLSQIRKTSGRAYRVCFTPETGPGSGHSRLPAKNGLGQQTPAARSRTTRAFKSSSCC
jgi:hypothetical protein